MRHRSVTYSSAATFQALADPTRRAVLDLTDDESAEGIDLASGSDAEVEGDDKARHRRRLQEMARIADSLQGELDAKLGGAIGIVLGVGASAGISQALQWRAASRVSSLALCGADPRP